MNTRFLTVCLNPVIQKTLVFDEIAENQVNRTNTHYFDASGKGINVSRVLASLGADVTHLTQLGEKRERLFLELIQDQPITLETVKAPGEVRFCYTLVQQNNQSTTELVEEGPAVGPDTEQAVRDKYEQIIESIDWVIISGSMAAGFSKDLYPWMTKTAKDAGKKVILDIRGDELVNALPYRPDYIKPNHEEFAMTFFGEKDFFPPRSYKQMASLYEKYNILPIITMGEQGVMYFDGKVKKIPAPRIKPVNTTGCGDAFTAGFSYEVAKSSNLSQAIEKGLECARLNALNPRPGYIE